MTDDGIATDKRQPPCMTDRARRRKEARSALIQLLAERLVRDMCSTPPSAGAEFPAALRTVESGGSDTEPSTQLVGDSSPDRSAEDRTLSGRPRNSHVNEHCPSV